MAAQAQWSEFLPLAGGYGADRNYVRPGHQNVARISPWLQKRMLLESEVVDGDSLLAHTRSNLIQFPFGRMFSGIENTL